MNDFHSLLDPSELSSFEKAIAGPNRRAIRLRDDRIGDELPFDVESVDWHSQGRFLCDPKVRPGSFLNYAAAQYYIQDAGSLLPVSLLDPRPGELICDLCAAPGGKSSAILERMGGQGILVANEPIRSRVDSLRYLLARTGHPNYLICQTDPDELSARFSGVFDAVLVDAPCSGQMMVGRD